MATPRTLRRIREHAGSTPHHPAIVTEEGRLSYRELVAAVDRRPPAAEPSSVQLVEADRTGAAVVAVLAGQVTSTPVLITPATAGEEYLASVAQDVASFEAIHRPGPGAPEAAAGYRSGGAWPEPAGGIWTTTSGSTGKPKIVAMDPAGIDRFLDWTVARFQLGPMDRVLSHAPMNFDIALLDIWATLFAGGTVVIAPPSSLTNGPQLAELVSRERISVIQAVPLVLRLLARAAGQPLRSVRVAISTGDFFPVDAIASLAEALPAAELLSIYGSTETNDSFVADLRNEVLPAGQPLLGAPIGATRYRIAGVADGCPGTGELIVDTPFQAFGYVNADNSRWQPARHGDGWEFATGDRVRRDEDGSLLLLGRIDRQVKVNGVRVSLDDVESAITTADGVVEAAVVARPDPARGSRIHAVVRVRSASETGNLAIRDHCVRQLVTAAIPHRILVTEQALPRTGTGKVDRNRTHEAFFERASR